METFIERINKLAVDTGDGSPNIIGSNLVIFEFKDFIRKLKKSRICRYSNDQDIIDELAGSVNVAKGVMEEKE